MIPSLKIASPLNTIINDDQKLLIWHIADLADIQPYLEVDVNRADTSKTDILMQNASNHEAHSITMQND